MSEITGLFERDIEEKIQKYLSLDYIVALIGPRQTGKTTLLHKFGQKEKSFYYSFDDVLLRNKIASDFYFLKKDLETRLGFDLSQITSPIYLLLDEAQKVPSVFDFVKILHDEYKGKIKILLSGSSSLEIQKKSAESLAGRAQYCYLYPLTIGELLKRELPSASPISLFPGFSAGNLNSNLIKEKQALYYPHLEKLSQLLEKVLVNGLLPGVWQKKETEKKEYLRSIVSLYLEKDIRREGLVKELENYQNFLEIISYRLGSILNLTHLSNQTQITTNTLRNYRSLLKNTFILNFLPPYLLSPQKRMVKNPKVYFYDVGIANFLSGREKIENIYDSKSEGAIFENIIIKSYESFSQNETLPGKVYFYRDYQNREIDLIIKKGNSLVPVEITRSTQIDRKKIGNLDYFLSANKKSSFGLLVYSGLFQEIKKTKSGKPLYALPWWLWS